MSKKLTYEFVKGKFEKEGYELLSNTYTNNKTKLKYRCPKGHEHQISYGEWNHLGNRCPYCSGKARKTIEFIKLEFNKEGYTLVTTIYKNAFRKLKYICPKGHEHSINWVNWSNGYRCPYCAGQIKPEIEFIRNEFKKEGYELLSKEYLDNKQKLKCICPLGHNYSISWNKWLMGRRCWVCSYIKRSGSNSSNWRGGISCEPYCQIWLDKEYKESIKERDNYKCQNPDCWGTSERLVIHHIDYVKKHCDPWNLITVCNSCNTRANKNRKYWQRLYEKCMKEVYNDE